MPHCLRITVARLESGIRFRPLQSERDQEALISEGTYRKEESPPWSCRTYWPNAVVRFGGLSSILDSAVDQAAFSATSLDRVNRAPPITARMSTQRPLPGESSTYPKAHWSVNKYSPPLPFEDGRLTYRIADAAYETRSVAITSNIHPSGFYTIMPQSLASLTVDRLLHNAHIVSSWP